MFFFFVVVFLFDNTPRSGITQVGVMRETSLTLVKITKYFQTDNILFIFINKLKCIVENCPFARLLNRLRSMFHAYFLAV